MEADLVVWESGESDSRDELRNLCAGPDSNVELVVVIWTSGTTAQLQITTNIAEQLVALGLGLRVEFADYGND